MFSALRHDESVALVQDDSGFGPLRPAAQLLDRSVPHLVRSFQQTFGISPHAYVIGRRIEAARAMLLRGTKPATVAVHVGFYDQAHFTRHFKRHTSIAPAKYAAGSR